jgi:molecular chaperone DnaK
VRIGGDGRHAVLGHDALDDCGGRDIDALLAGHLTETGGAELAALLAPPAADDAAARLARLRLGVQVRECVRNVKHQLSDAEDVEDYLTPLAPPYALRRADLATLVAPLLARTVDCCTRLLAAAGVRADDVTAVLLAGGTCRMPVVAETLERALGRPVRHTEDPDLAVVQGAAALAALAGDGALDPVPADPQETPLRWATGGVLVRWLVEPGAAYPADAPLVVVRAPDSALWRLCAPAEPGTVVRHHYVPGEPVAAGDWLLTVRRS